MQELELTFHPSGLKELDHILNGGYLNHNAYLVRGGPGTGKTTLGMHYLQEGLQQNESVLFISFNEQKDKLIRNARTMNFNTDEIPILDLAPGRSFFKDGQSSSVFEDADVDLDPLIDQITKKVDELEPDRIFLDSLTQLRFLAPSKYQFHKYALSLTNYLLEHAHSILLVSESSSELPDDDLQFLSDGVINLEWDHHGRNLYITKLRGADFKSGIHSYEITSEGLKIYPKLEPHEEVRKINYSKLPFGVPEIDEMVHGGIERGCCTLITGPSGVGKTTLGMQFMKEAAGRGERSVLYLFDEKKELLVRRCESIGIPIRDMLDTGHLEIIEFTPEENSLNQFNDEVQRQVEKLDTSIIMIDSIRGYELMADTDNLSEALHPLNTYLKNMGVTALLINEVEYITGNFRITDVGISYMSDIVIFLRFMEFRGAMQKAIGIIKNRLSDYEKTLRQYEITRYGLKVGEPLDNLRGILTGSPSFVSDSKD